MRLLARIAVILTALMIVLLAYNHASVLEVTPDPKLLDPAFQAAPTVLATPPLGAKPGAYFQNAILEARRDGSHWLLLGIVLVATLLRVFAPKAQRRIRTSALFGMGYLVTVPLCGILSANLNLATYGYVRGFSIFCHEVTLVSFTSIYLFDIVFAQLRIATAAIIRDLFTGAAFLIIVISIFSRGGANLQGILTGSAILTALVGLSIQNTLGDAVSGVLIEVENSMQVGDWVKVGDVVGRVAEIRWRYTTIETRNWEKVVIPNSNIIKNQVMVLGHRSGQPVQLRRWVYFQVGFEHAPTKVIRTVEDALNAAPIERVAAEPRPNCILYDFKEYAGYYAVRYWLTDIAVDDPTDSAVRTRIYFALGRAGIRFARPQREIEMTAADAAELGRQEAKDRAGKLNALRRVTLFSMLKEDELGALVPHLHHAPFSKGEVLTKQGADAHWLYLLVRGQARVDVRLANGETKHISSLKDGDYFGEMALLTGEKRSATVTAETDCDCWRLDHTGFREVLMRRPEIAEELSQILAARRVGIQELESKAGSAPPQTLAAAQQDLLAQISEFFGLG